MSLDLVQKFSQKAFKMKIVLELLSLSRAERSARINELSEKEFEIPFSSKKHLSRSTLYTWIKEYEAGEEALRSGDSKSIERVLIRKEREDKGKHRKLALEHQKALLRWRFENTYRTCENLREELLENNTDKGESIASVSVIRRFLRKNSLNRKTLLKKEPEKQKIRMAFEADYPNQLWMIDTKGPNIQIPSPKDPNEMLDAMPIVVLDDCSRFVTGVRYICKGQENEGTVMEVLMDAFDQYGIPNALYTDRGSPYMGKALEKALFVLGCRVLHTKPRDCSAKGKVEKIMQLYYQDLDTELCAKQIEKTLSLPELNEYAAATTHAYHMRVHRELEEKPYERYLNYPGKFRRYVQKQILSMLFLPTTRSKVTKDNLILLNRRNYLVPVVGYDKKWVEVRYKFSQPEFVYIWYEGKFIGIGEEYVPQNNFLERQKYLQQNIDVNAVEIPDEADVPEYRRLERKLLEHRSFMENRESINAELALLQKQRAQIVSEMTQGGKTSMGAASEDIPHPLKDKIDSAQTQSKEEHPPFETWSADGCIHLLSSLFRRILSPQERFAIHRVFRAYGPFEEKTVRQVVGKLLGESCPTTDVTAYLDAMRIEAMIQRDGGIGK